MKPIYEKTIGMTEAELSYCPGCGHGIAHKLIMDVLDKKGLLGDTIGVSPIGCSVIAHQYMNVEMCEAAHGRAPAVATGIKRVHPDKFVYTYQGDGDLASIGTTEIVHAAVRAENICVFFINNAIYGMTGGQMAPTTLIGQRATTAVLGRDAVRNGRPIHVSEMLATIEGAAYVERVSIDSPAAIRITRKAIERVVEVQQRKLGLAFLEILSTCPTNWGVTAPEAMSWLRENMIPYYPLGVLKRPEGI